MEKSICVNAHKEAYTEKFRVFGGLEFQNEACTRRQDTAEYVIIFFKLNALVYLPIAAKHIPVVRQEQ